jgi:chromosomal replication initiation ATPase DnaA
MSQSLSDRGEISLTTIERVLLAYDAVKQKRPPKERMLEVCERYGITPALLRSHNRPKVLAPPRLELARILYADGLTYEAIGRIMNREPTGICHTLKKTRTP